MESAKVRALSAQCLSIRLQADEIIRDSGTVAATIANIVGRYNADEKVARLEQMMSDLKSQANSLLVSYNFAKNLAKEIGLELPTISAEHITTKSSASRLRELIAACDMAIGFAAQRTNVLTPDEMDKLNRIRKEVEKTCEKLDINFGKNLELATIHYERGDFLGSVLISSRVITYTLAQIDGADIDEKISTLVRNNIIPSERSDVKQAIIKANKKSRDFLAHRIDVYADPSDAHSILGDCIKILKIFVELQDAIGKS